MRNDEKSPVNEWDFASARLGYLTGGPLDNLVAQLARSGVSAPTVVAQLPVIAPDSDALVSARLGPAGS